LCKTQGVEQPLNELIVSEKSDHVVLPDDVLDRAKEVLLDYKHGLPQELAVQKPVPKASTLWIRRIWDGRNSLRPLNLSHPIRGELELAYYGRKKLLDFFRDAETCISLPFMCFIDEFGLYRNMYRSLLGIYWIPAGFSASDRQRRQNVYTLTLGPHGANFDDVIAALRPSLARLDEGLPLIVNGQPRNVMAFTIAFIGDMPQQEKNSGSLGHGANRGCRFCHVDKESRGDLNYDTLNLGRYHFHNEAIRDHLSTLNVNARRAAWCKKWGINEHPTPLTAISPSLDLVLSRPSDPAHSEFKGIGNAAHELLCEAILNEPGRPTYLAQLQAFPFPPGWSRLQSPLHHLKSYTLSENARATVILPLLLRSWLSPQFIKKYFITTICQQYDKPVNDDVAVDLIVSSFAMIAKCTSLLSSRRISASDRQNVVDIIRSGRGAFQNLFQAAMDASSANPRTKSLAGAKIRGRQNVRTPTPVGSPVSSRAPSADSARSIKETVKREEYKRQTKKPNFHIGLHYIDQILEYACSNNCNVLAGEERHKYTAATF
jgi:hypothetical protein